MNPYSFTQQTPPKVVNSPPLPTAPPMSVGGNAPLGLHDISTSANSTSTSPFGYSPDLSHLSDQDRRAVNRLSDLTFNLEGGGYYFSDAPYIGGIPRSDPRANRAAQDAYNIIGAQPTIANTTPALATLNQQRGVAPTQYPSLTDRLHSVGYTGDYGGPFETKLYHPTEDLRRLYGI